MKKPNRPHSAFELLMFSLLLLLFVIAAALLGKKMGDLGRRSLQNLPWKSPKFSVQYSEIYRERLRNLAN